MWTKLGEPYTRSASIFTMPEFIQEYGVDAMSILDEVGISREAASNPNLYISMDRHSQFVERAAELCNEPNFGIKHSLSLPRNFPNSGPLMMMSHFCDDLRNWIELASKYGPVYCNGYRPFLEVDETGKAYLRFLEPPLRQMLRHTAEGLMMTLLRMVMEVLQRPELTLRTVRFRHPAPADVSLHEAAFRCPVEFNAKYTEFVFDAHLLDIRLDGRFGLFRGVMDAYLKGQIRRIFPEKTAIASVVAEAIPIVLGTELCTAGHVANSLGMSEKKMQRLLQQEGESFRSVLQEVRQNLALTILAQSSVSVEALAEFLGYSTNAAFTRAFSVWANCSPSAYRRQHQGKSFDDQDQT
jgi:AraC-like DNA-binding protein